MHGPQNLFSIPSKKKSDRNLRNNFNWLWDFLLFLFFQKINMHAKKVSEPLLFWWINRELLIKKKSKMILKKCTKNQSVSEPWQFHGAPRGDWKSCFFKHSFWNSFSNTIWPLKLLQKFRAVHIVLKRFANKFENTSAQRIVRPDVQRGRNFRKKRRETGVRGLRPREKIPKTSTSTLDTALRMP